jgi:hypothetical protein
MQARLTHDDEEKELRVGSIFLGIIRVIRGLRNDGSGDDV